MSSSNSGDRFFTELVQLQREARTRNLREWVACLALALGAAFIAFRGDDWLVSLSLGALSLGAVYIGYRLFRDGRVAVPPIDNVSQVRRVLERELDRQVRLLGSVSSWYVAPLALGWFGLVTAMFLKIGLSIGPIAVLLCGVLIGSSVVLINRKAASDLRERLRVLQGEQAS